MKTDIYPQKVPGTHGKMFSKSEFDVFELVPDKRDTRYFSKGKKLFSGSKQECEDFVATQVSE